MTFEGRKPFSPPTDHASTHNVLVPTEVPSNYTYELPQAAGAQQVETLMPWNPHFSISESEYMLRKQIDKRASKHFNPALHHGFLVSIGQPEISLNETAMLPSARMNARTGFVFAHRLLSQFREDRTNISDPKVLGKMEAERAGRLMEQYVQPIKDGTTKPSANLNRSALGRYCEHPDVHHALGFVHFMADALQRDFQQSESIGEDRDVYVRLIYATAIAQEVVCNNPYLLKRIEKREQYTLETYEEEDLLGFYAERRRLTEPKQNYGEKEVEHILRQKKSLREAVLEHCFGLFNEHGYGNLVDFHVMMKSVFFSNNPIVAKGNIWIPDGVVY